MSEPTDNELVNAFLIGHPEAFHALFERHKTRVYNTALSIVRDREEALDLLQEVFLTVFRKVKSFRGQSRFTTWRISITVNSSINRAKRRKLHPSVPFEDGPAVAPAFQSQSRDVLAHAFARLDPSMRAVLTLRYFEGTDYPEIAEIVGCPSGTVKSRLNRAHQKIKELLDHDL